MYKKIISTLVIGTLLAGTLTGCGGSSDAGSSAKSSGKTELELFSTKPENKDTIQKLVDKYNESHDDVTVKVTAPPDAGTVLKTRMAKNDMPDIVAMGGDNNYTEVEGAGMLLDLGDQDYIKDVQEAYIDMVYDVNKDKEETIYGVPFATNASGVIYNTEKFEELGLEVPKTWDEFIDILQKIKDAGEQPLLMTYKDAWTANAPWNSIAADLAPESFADDRKAGDHPGDKAGQRGTHDAHLKVEDEHGVAADVHHVHHQTGQHADLAVALCAEERSTGVVHTDEGIAQRREQEIRLGVAHDVGVNGAEDAPQDAVPPHRDHGGDHGAERDHDEQDLGGGGLGVLRFPVADVLAGDDGAAGGKRAEQLDHQHVERVHQADARHGRFADRGDHQGIGQTDGHAERLLGDQRQQQGAELFAGKQRLGCCGCHSSSSCSGMSWN